MGILSAITNAITPSFINKGVDVLDKGMDMVEKGFFTKQEMAEMAGEYYKLSLNESTERSITRRWIAIRIIAFYFWYLVANVGWYSLGFIVRAFGWENVDGTMFTNIGNVMKDMAQVYQLHLFAGAVMVFFFGNYLVGKIKGSQ